MQVAPILAPDGDAYFTWGGPDAHATGAAHGFIWSREWTKARRRFVRCLVIGPETPIVAFGHRRAGAWLIADSALTALFSVNRDGRATGAFEPTAVDEVRKGLEIMGKDPNDRASIKAVMSLIESEGPAVWLMPVAPRRVQDRARGSAMWDIQARAKSSGKTISEVSV